MARLNMLNTTTLNPTCVNPRASAAHSFTMAATENATRTSTLINRIGFSARSANRGARTRTTMPTTTGTMRVAITSINCPTTEGTISGPAAKYMRDQLQMTGSVTMLKSVLRPVSDTFSATLPPNTWLYRHDEMLPGAAASSINPTA